MSTLSPATEAALAGIGVVIATALRIDLAGATIRLLDGAGLAIIDGQTFTGRDDVFGTVSAIEPVSDGVDNEAPSLTFLIMPPSNAAMAALASPRAQGSPVSASFVVIDPSSGLIVGDPIPLFDGVFDQPTLKVGKGSKALQMSCVTLMDEFLRNDEGARMNNAFHQSIWPGETGFEFVSSIEVRPPWGSDAPRVTLVPNTTRY